MIIIAIEYLGDLLEKLAITARVFDEARQNGCYVFKFSVQLICIWGGDGRSGGRAGGREAGRGILLHFLLLILLLLLLLWFLDSNLQVWTGGILHPRAPPAGSAAINPI